MGSLLPQNFIQDPRLQEFASYVAESRVLMTWIDFLDIAFIGVLISISLVWIQKRTARSVLFVLIPMLFAYGAAKTLKMQLTLMMFQFGLLTLAISIVVIFQEDFRRAFEAIASFRIRRKARVDLPENLPEMLTKCLSTMSKDHTGGLVVMQGRESIERFIRGGIPLGGAVSIPLLQSIFDNHSPGHDGGVVIIDGKLDKFAVHLPLARNAQGTGRLGTRHAAALGLSEKCDALILVVSEETGTISIAKNGKLQVSKSETALFDAVRDHLRKLSPVPVYRSIFRVPWLRLTTSLALSFILWLTLVRPLQTLPFMEHRVPVQVIYKESSERNPNSKEVRVDPPFVTLKLPRAMKPPTAIATEPIDLAALRNINRMHVHLHVPTEIPANHLSEKTVEVFYQP